MTLKEFYNSEDVSKQFENKSFDDLTAKETADLYGKYMESLQEQIKQLEEKQQQKSGSDSEDLQKQVTEMKEQFNESLYKAMEEQRKALQTIATQQPSVKGKDPDPEFKQQIQEVLECAKKGEDGDFTLKANALTSSVSGNTAGLREDEISRPGNRMLSIQEILPEITLPKGADRTYIYTDWDEGTLSRAATGIAEGTTYPESTAGWQEQSLELKKRGDTIPFSEEFEYDSGDRFVRELRWFLDTNVRIDIEDQIVNGDGTGNNFNGMVNVVPAYTATASGVTDPNILDLISLMRQSITSTEGSKFQPNVVIMSSADEISTDFFLKKDANNNYLPLLELMGELGYRLVVSDFVASNTLFVGDIRFARMIQAEGINIQVGRSGSDFVNGLKTLRVTARKNFLIRNLDQNGFLESTDIAADLTTIGT